jgi:hypothetical protein
MLAGGEIGIAREAGAGVDGNCAPVDEKELWEAVEELGSDLELKVTWGATSLTVGDVLWEELI